MFQSNRKKVLFPTVSIPISQRQSLLILFFVYSSRNFVCIYKACELPQWLSDKESAQNAGDVGSVPGSGRPPGRRKRQPTPVFLPEKFHGQRSWADHSSWGHRENWTQRPQQQYGTQSHTRGQAHTLTCSDFFFPRSDNIIHTVLQLAFSLNISWAFFHSKTYVLK